MRLQDYPNGTRIAVAERKFVKVEPGTFWREEHAIPGNCVSRPSISLEGIEALSGAKHVVIERVQPGK